MKRLSAIPVIYPIAALVAVAVIAGFQMTRGSQATEPAADGAMVVVTMPELSALAAEGQKLYGEHCAACHGVNGAGHEGAGPPHVHIIYEPGHHGDAAFQLAVQQGVRAHHWNFGDMLPVKGVTPDEVDKMIVFVREVQRANGIQ
jgi:mono/diheme cytochrome c family protein